MMKKTFRKTIYYDEKDFQENNLILIHAWYSMVNIGLNSKKPLSIFYYTLRMVLYITPQVFTTRCNDVDVRGKY